MPPHRPRSSEGLRERQLRDELKWFLRRDWAVLLADRRIVSTFLQRATRAILLLEELDEQAHRPIDRTSDTAAVEAIPDAAPSALPANLPEPAAEPEPASVSQSPLSVDQVELYEFGKPRVSEHPLHNDCMILSFCASFYHEGEFVFSRSHLLLMLDTNSHLTWLAGPFATGAVGLPHATPGAFFSLLGRGITQIVTQHQPELRTRMKQGERFHTYYRLVGAVLPDIPRHGLAAQQERKERQRWIAT